jgi:hypothetical protein
MRSVLPCLTLLLSAGFAVAAEQPKLILTDPGLPLQEIRPLDRRVHIITLEGDWKEAPRLGAPYYVNVLFPNGQGYSNRPLDEELFRLGEVRCVIQDYQLIRNGTGKGGKLTIVVSVDKPVTSAKAAEVVSNALVLDWPLDRPVTRRPVRSKFAPPPPVDELPPEEPPSKAKRPREKVPPPKPLDK